MANTIFVGGLSAFSDWTAGALLGPTAASATIEDRVTDGGRGLRKVTMLLTGGNQSEPKYALTDWLGGYRFKDVPVGQTYIITPQSRRYQFTPAVRVYFLGEDLSNADFIGGSQPAP